MGHHIFIWRIERATESGELRIFRNVFADAPQGAAVYSSIAPEAEAQICMNENLYRMKKRKFYCRIGGRNYDGFEDYRKNSGKDADSVNASENGYGRET